MEASENRRRCRVASSFLVALLVSPFALCQWGGQSPSLPPLTSRSASVLLVATVEGLSVTASPVSVPAPQNAANYAVAITTSWTIPADATTLRLTGYQARPTLALHESQISGDQVGVGSSVVSRAASGSTQQSTSAAQPQLMSIVQPAGATSRPGSRTDVLQFATDPSDAQAPRPDSHSVDILVQAL